MSRNRNLSPVNEGQDIDPEVEVAMNEGMIGAADDASGEASASDPFVASTGSDADASAADSEHPAAPSEAPFTSSDPSPAGGDADDLAAIQDGIDAAQGDSAAAEASEQAEAEPQPTAKEAVEQAIDTADPDEPLIAIEPVRDYFINGVPHVAQEVPASVAAVYVKTGAFTYADPDDAPAGD